MDVLDAILKRASIRKWKSTPVEKEKIEKVLEAGRRAPPWENWTILMQIRAFETTLL